MDQASQRQQFRKQTSPQDGSSHVINHNGRKRAALEPPATPPGRPRKAPNSSLQGQTSSVLQGLFEAERFFDLSPSVDLKMSDFESDSDSFQDTDPGHSPEKTPGSSQGTARSTPPSAGSVTRLHERKLPRQETPEHPLSPRSNSTQTLSAKVKQLPQKTGSGAEEPTDEVSRGTVQVYRPAPLAARSGRVAPFVVVESHMRIKIMKKQHDGRLAVPWGVQYYLASLVSFGLFSLDELIVTTGINALRSTSNAESICALFDPQKQHLLWEPGVDSPIMARRITGRERRVCEELDREAGLRADSPLNGVTGRPGEDMRSFGGLVLFEGRIKCTKNEERPQPGKARKHRLFSIQLLPPKLGGSCRFSRRFGSESILRLKMDTAMVKDARRFALHPKTREIQQEISDFFMQTVQILGRSYRPFICKDETIFYLWIGSPSDCPDQPEFDCIWDFINHHAPFAQNGRSSLGKFIQRVHLGLSTSVPASFVETIIYVRDIFGDPDPTTGKRMEMTDGAGAVSLAVAQDIARHLGFPSIPSAFQARVAGAKGVWYVDPAAEGAPQADKGRHWIKVRDSQKKINYLNGKSLDRSQQIVDLLGPSRTFAPSTLSKQIILVLHSNGVPIRTFADMQRGELQKIGDEISNWEGPDEAVRMRLATVVERLCKVEAMRAKRSTESAEHRAQGMDSQKGDRSADSDQSLGDDDREIFYGQDGRHIWNGKPLSKYECAYEMLQVGFHPNTCPYLAKLMEEIAEFAMKKVIQRFAIPVARSAEAMVIPDPTGTLEEGEIQFRFSGDAILDPDTRLRLMHVPEGDVLVTRHPCLLPTDIRKVRAVVRPELSMYQDVVIFSTKGQRPLASLLSGGDYDGDLIRVFWEPELVKPFENAEVRYADCPFELDEVFDRSDETVADFVARHAQKAKEERDRILVKELVAGAFQPAVRGLYGVMHLYAAWQFGTRSAEAIELAHKFCQCMDSQKTGLTLKEEVRIADSKMYMGELPEWAQDATDDRDSRYWFGTEDKSVSRTVLKNKDRPESVLCALWAEGKVEMGKVKLRVTKQTEKLLGKEDTALSGPWNEAIQLGAVSAEEQEAIRNHVKVMEVSFKHTNARLHQTIELKSREQRNGHSPSKASQQSRARLSKGTPLRRVRSDANPALLDRRPSTERPSGSSAVDDLDRSDLLERLEETIEVPAMLGSAGEVAARFCQWPKAFAKDYITKKDPLAVERLEKLRASYAYSITYKSGPRFAFEMAWKWMMYLKTQGRGSMSMPYSTLDLLGLRKKMINRTYDMSQGLSVEL